MTPSDTPRQPRDVEGPRAGAAADTRALEVALGRQTALIHEIDHRVKNNLQLISSLLLLKARRLEPGEGRETLQAMIERINAMSMVHRRLVRDGDTEQFDLGQFLNDLTNDLNASARRPELDVSLTVQPINAPAAFGAPLALIANELVANALRHAYAPPGGGRIDVALRRAPDGVELEVSDCGCGMGASLHGFGLTIVQMLSQQVRGTFSLSERQPGLRALVMLPMSLGLT